ncbi:MAG TPA: hypothetical protein VG709_08025 [Actinomycetota bacterium]|nr:hypothetical protein [Actinomycetota bacterium]
MRINFITPCPVYANGGAHACGPIDWGPAEIGIAVEAFLVQESAYARGSESFSPSDAMWELHTDPVQGKLKPGLAVGFGVARVTMRSKHEGDVLHTVCWCDVLTLVDEATVRGGQKPKRGGGRAKR